MFLVQAAPRALILIVCLAAGTSISRADDPIRVDFGRSIGEIRPLHGINCGPVCENGLVDLTERYRELDVPLVRLHDCHWPNPDVVDVHTIFPDFDADPNEPASYRFAKTDAYLDATHATGARIVYRLGESIDHGAIREHVHPPRDYDKWATICLAFVKRYGEPSADGVRPGIEYCEIWNEPENRPAMWSGTDEDYFRLYAVTARKLKAAFPSLKIGGPAVGATGVVENGEYRPSDFVVDFLDFCRREALPLDFFSWHGYADDPEEFIVRAKGIRKLLDERGFEATESHLNEWNYLPENDWGPLLLSGQGETRRRWHERTTGPQGAAFTATALVRMQDAPIDAANFYRGEIGGFSCFDHFGSPTKAFFGLKAFAIASRTPRRCAVENIPPGVVALAGVDAEGRRGAVLLTQRMGEPRTQAVEIEGLVDGGKFRWTLQVVDAERSLETIAEGRFRGPTFRVDVPLAAPCVALLRIESP